MRRISMFALVVSCLLFLSATSSGIAGRASSSASQVKDHAGPWKMLKNGVQVLEVWKLKGSPEWPQVAVLRMPEAEFKRFEANPKDYVNEQNVFPVAVNSVSIRDNCCPPPKDGERMVVLMHCPGSASCALCTQPK